MFNTKNTPGRQAVATARSYIVNAPIDRNWVAGTSWSISILARSVSAWTEMRKMKGHFADRPTPQVTRVLQRLQNRKRAARWTVRSISAKKIETGEPKLQFLLKYETRKEIALLRCAIPPVSAISHALLGSSDSAATGSWRSQATYDQDRFNRSTRV